MRDASLKYALGARRPHALQQHRPAQFCQRAPVISLRGAAKMTLPVETKRSSRLLPAWAAKCGQVLRAGMCAGLSVAGCAVSAVS